MRTIVDLIRHGEPVGGRRYRGKQDDPLSEKGWQQMWQALGEGHPWTRVWTSPLARCHAFAQRLAGLHGLPLIVDQRLEEVGFGSWEGRTPQEIEAEHPGWLARFKSDPVNVRPPGAEALEDFRARVASVWEEMLARSPGEHLLVVCHAGVIRMTLAHVLGVPLRQSYLIDVPTAGVTRLSVEGSGSDARPVLHFHGGRL